MNGSYCPPGKKPQRTMKEVFGKAPPNPANAAKKLSGVPAPPMKGKK